MSDYIYYGKNESEVELKHYGVLGMKWGVRRARRQLSKATTSEGRQRAISKLQSHKAKATRKIQKLEKKHEKLKTKVDKAIEKQDVKAAKLGAKAAKLRRKQHGFFTSQEKAEKLDFKATKLEARAKELEAMSKKAKAKIAANENLTNTFKSGVNDIDQALVSAGKKYIED